MRGGLRGRAAEPWRWLAAFVVAAVVFLAVGPMMRLSCADPGASGLCGLPAVGTAFIVLAPLAGALVGLLLPAKRGAIAVVAGAGLGYAATVFLTVRVSAGIPNGAVALLTAFMLFGAFIAVFVELLAFARVHRARPTQPVIGRQIAKKALGFLCIAALASVFSWNCFGLLVRPLDHFINGNKACGGYHLIVDNTGTAEITVIVNNQPILRVPPSQSRDISEWGNYHAGPADPWVVEVERTNDGTVLMSTVLFNDGSDGRRVEVGDPSSDVAWSGYGCGGTL